jgi:fatty acid CoA ligase FadD21
MPQSTLLSLLHGRASMRPDVPAFTYTNYENDWAGVNASLTWSQLYRRTVNVARELQLHGSVGDRAVILAPQGLEYVTAFLGAMQAGLVAVPLPLPHRGSHHDRVSSVVSDTSPSVVLTTSAVAEDVGDYVDQSRVDTAPKIVEIDSLNLDIDAGGSGLVDPPSVAYLQYSSGSTRLPTGVRISHRNVQVNFDQLMRSFFADLDGQTKYISEATIVSWLPLYHDMGLVLGVCAPILSGYPAILSNPVAFLERPARWIQALASNPNAFSAAPNFAFDLAARRTADSDLAGLDLGGVLGIINGAERVDPATLERFADRFAHFNFRDNMLRPSYGMAEATVFVASGVWDSVEDPARFDADELAAGRARRCTDGTGTTLVKYRLPHSPSVHVVDYDTNRECPENAVGEIWVHGENVADGYWNRPPDEQRCFDATLVDPPVGVPEAGWLRTGDLGFVSGRALFIVGRIKDLLIIRGRNYYPEDIEATVQKITNGRVAAIAVPVDSTEHLVTVIELKKRGDSDDAAKKRFGEVKSAVTAAISNSHGLKVGDIVLVPAGSLPTTTSGKIRRAACVEQYSQDQFARLDA